jgi:hypothetical protein
MLFSKGLDTLCAQLEPAEFESERVGKTRTVFASHCNVNAEG